MGGKSESIFFILEGTKIFEKNSVTHMFHNILGITRVEHSPHQGWIHFCIPFLKGSNHATYTHRISILYYTACIRVHLVFNTISSNTLDTILSLFHFLLNLVIREVCVCFRFNELLVFGGEAKVFVLSLVFAITKVER